MLLVADIGNTNITLGIYENEKLLETFRLISDKNLSCQEYEKLVQDLLKDYSINSCIIASVVNDLDLLLKSAVDNVFGIKSMVLTQDLDFGVELDLDNPEELGADRAANAYGAYVLYKKPVIVVDLGTATTFDILNSEGVFCGGLIMAGLKMQLEALNRCTSKLPKIEIDKVDSAIACNTRDAILSGVIRGSACAIEGLIAQCEYELGERATIVATGGYSSLISEYMERKFDYVNPSLTLDGLRLIYNLNK